MITWLRNLPTPKMLSDMDALISKHPDCNYAEVVMTKSDEEPCLVHFESEETQHLINQFAAAHSALRPSRRHLSVTLLPTMVQYYYPQDDISKVYHMRLLEHAPFDGYVVNLYHNTPVPLFSFPSNREDIDHMEVSRTTFKMDKNAFVNFESVEYEDGTLCNHVYANINFPHQTAQEVVSSAHTAIAELARSN